MLKSVKSGILFSVGGMIGAFILMLILIGIGVGSLYIFGIWGVISWPILFVIALLSINHYVTHGD